MTKYTLLGLVVLLAGCGDNIAHDGKLAGLWQMNVDGIAYQASANATLDGTVFGGLCRRDGDQQTCGAAIGGHFERGILDGYVTGPDGARHTLTAVIDGL